MSNKKPNLSNERLNNIASFLNCHYQSGVLQKGMIQEAASIFGVSRRTIGCIWGRAKEQLLIGFPIELQNQNNNINQGRRKLFDAEIIKAIPVQLRSTYRRMGREVGVSKNTIMRWKNTNMLRPHTNYLKPILTGIAKLKRLKFCLQSLHVDRTHASTETSIKFKSMQHIIHVDEKWFNLKQKCERHYLTIEEEESYRSCQNKNFILKVMFLCVVGRPLYDSDGGLLFDGKIGMFPFAEIVPAKRNSRNRERGTLETKPIQSITKEVMKFFMINKVIPAIKAKWPMFESTNILIQQDNAMPHFLDTDPDFRAVASADGFNIHLGFQPPSSPDLNVNDLGWFRALQSLQQETRSYKTDELADAVASSFQSLESYKLNRVYQSLQSCIIEILKQRGHNAYKLPHLKKDELEREGRLPTSLEVDITPVKECIDYLLQKGEASDVSELMEDMGYDGNATGI